MKRERIIRFILYSLALSCCAATSQLDTWELLIQQSRTLTDRNCYPEAVTIAKQALELATDQYGEQHKNTISALHNLAHQYHENGQYEDAERSYQQALSLAEQIDPAPTDLATLYLDAGKLYLENWQFSDASSMLHSAYTIRQDISSNSLDVAEAMYYDAEVDLLWTRYTNALKRFQQAYDIRSSFVPPDHPLIAESLVGLAQAYYQLADYTKAIDLLKQATSIQEKQLGPNDPALSITLFHLAESYHQVDRYYPESAEILSRAIEIGDMYLPFQHPYFAKMYKLEGDLYFEHGQFKEAKQSYQRAYDAQKALYDEHHIAMAPHIDTQAIIHTLDGHDLIAMGIHDRAWDVRAHTFSRFHLYTAISILNLANSYRVFGDYAKAASYTKWALNNRENALGTEHPLTAEAALQLADIYAEQGNYLDAEKLALDSIQKLQHSHGFIHPVIAYADQTLATIYTHQGDYTKAMELLQESISILEQMYGTDNINTAIAKDKLASLYLLIGDTAKAKLLMEDSFLIITQFEKTKRPYMMSSFENKADLRMLQDQPKEAIILLQQTLSIQRTRPYGWEHPISARLNIKLGDAYAALGDLAQAESAYQAARQSLDKNLYTHHPDYARVLNAFAKLYGTLQEPDKAISAEFICLQAVDRFLESFSQHASDEQLVQYLQSIDHYYDVFYSLLSRYFIGLSDIAEAALQKHLNYKFRVENILILRKQLSLAQNNPTSQTLFDEYAKVTRTLSHLLLSPSIDQHGEYFQGQIKKLTDRKTKLEQRIVSQTEQTISSIPATQVPALIQHLPTNSLYIDFVRYRKYNFSKASWDNTHHYLAFMVTKDPDGIPVFDIKDIGNSSTIDSWISEWRGVLEGDTSQDTSVQETNDLIKKLAQELYSHLLYPFTHALAAAERIYISPGGNLHTIPFELLVNPATGQYMLDTHTIQYTSGALITPSPATTPNTNTFMAVFANPDYQGIHRGNIKPNYYQAKRDNKNTWPLQFQNLPGTTIELDAISRLVPTNISYQPFSGIDATETRIKQLEHPSILHLATHGFFLNNPNDTSPHNNLSAYYNPLLLSGLAMAGSNHLKGNNPIMEDEEDGLLTALEISTINLNGTELAVLSGCDTGLGAMQRGKGVAGLRHAFKVAGAKYIIMSLWAVPDEETAWLMEQFYGYYFSGKSPPEALSLARKKLRAKLKKELGYDDPYYWASFIVDGPIE